MSTGSAQQQLFHVPYSGHITALDVQSIKLLEAVEAPEAMRILDAQMNRVYDAGINVSMVKPAVAGGLIVRCNPKDVQGIYDQVFGTSENVRAANVIKFSRPTNDGALASATKTHFRNAALGYISPVAAFTMASIPVRSANTNDRNYSLDMAA